MRAILAVLTVIGLAGCGRASAPNTHDRHAARRPNIIVIVSDDHGFADLGVNQADPDIRTPQLDALAADGVHCTHGYVSAPQCSPSRAGLITGRYQQRFGLEDNLSGPLPLEELTIAELLKPAGYVSGQVGKWHLEQRSRRRGAAVSKATEAPATAEAGEADAGGRHDPFMPAAQGFDEYFCGANGQYVASHDLQGKPLRDAPEVITDRRFRIEVQTEAALSFIGRHAKEPFFLYLAYFAPHVPLQSPEPFFSQTPKHLPLERRQALAMIAAMDDGVGRIRARLRELDLERETLFVFLSDNGAPTRDVAWNGSLNTPFVGEKGMLTEGGVRVPFLIAWPGRLPAGTTFNRPVSSLDVAATALAAAGRPVDDRLDGVNLLPYLDGSRPEPPHEALYWRWRSQAAMLRGDWKFLRLGADRRYLFDLGSPEGERLNRIAQHAALAEELERDLDAWSQGLQPPGLPLEVQRAEQLFFREHFGEAAGMGASSEGDAKPRD